VGTDGYTLLSRLYLAKYCSSELNRMTQLLTCLDLYYTLLLHICKRRIWKRKTSRVNKVSWINTLKQGV